MPGVSSAFWGVGPHTLYHPFGQEVVVAVYDAGSREVIEGAIIKNWWGYTEVLLPMNASPNGCVIVAVG